MKILIIGSGGREHALAWKLAQSPDVSQVFVAPGNAGTHEQGKISNVHLSVLDFDELIAFAQNNKIYFTVVGPELPLAEGIVDRFEQAGLRCFGPHQAAAQLEASKGFCKEFLERHHIPTAKYQRFTSSQLNEALAYAKAQTLPIVIKADGLAAGKGVVIAQTHGEAEQTLKGFLTENQLGQAGHSVIIEQFLQGQELSFMVLADGLSYLVLPSSQDHKRLLDQDLGPNTGGMGAFSPSPLLNSQLEQCILTTIIEPTLAGLMDEGRRYRGFLYAGLMICDGQPYVLEFNCRLGDPETEVLMFRIVSDLVELIDAAFTGKLDQQKLICDPQSALCVVLAAANYPASPQKGQVISGLPLPAEFNHTTVFQAGTRCEQGQVVTDGGRVLCVTSKASSLEDARQNCYQAIAELHFDGMQYRTDIGTNI